MSEPVPGLAGSLRCLGAHLIGLLQTRLELATTELEEQKLWLVSVLSYALAGAFLLALGIVISSIFLVVAFWDSHRLLVLGLLAGGSLLAGALAMATAVAQSRARPRFLGATLAELERDRQALKP